MTTETFTVTTAYSLGNSHDVHLEVWAGSAETRNEAVQRARDALEEHFNGAVIHDQSVFLGWQEPLEPSATPFDFIGNSPGVDDDEKELFRSIVSGERTDRLAIMSAFFGRDPVHCIVSVYQTEEDFLIEPLYIRIDNNLMQKLRSPDGDLVGKIADD